MKSFVNRFVRLLGLLAFVVFTLPWELSAQERQEYQDDPDVDNTVGLVPPSFLFPSLPAIITTPDGFDNFDLGITNAEPHMSTNPLNPLWFFNAFNTNTTFHTENGLTWATNNPAFPNAAGDPVSAYDSLGNLYYETMKNPITGCWVVRSSDNGRTWSAAVTSVAGRDKNWMAADQTMGPYSNYVYTTMTATNPTGNFARSTDFGATWTTTFSPTTQVLPGMMVAVGPNVMDGNNISGGCVYVVTHSGTNSAGIYTFYVSTDGGSTFTLKSSNQFSNYIGTELSGRSTVQGMRCRPYPMIASDNSFGPYRGRFYLVYASNDPPGNGNKSDIFLRYSTDQGTTWSAATIVNDDPNSQNNFQFHPAIWCDKETGRLYIKFYDTRRVPTSDSMDVYATYTDDGGATFALNQRLTNRTFRINFTGAAGPTYRGDYDAIAANRHVAGAVWTDFRNSNYLGMFSYFPDFAMLVSPAADTLMATDSTIVQVKVPAVKLYSYPVRFSVTVSPSDSISIDLPLGDSLTVYPDSIPMAIRTQGAAAGTYVVTVTGEGPNGTPVHRRVVEITVTAPAITVTAPNGGESWRAGSQQTIRWASTLVDSVRVDYSTDNGSTWNVITPSAPAPPGLLSWNVPYTATREGRVRIVSIDSVAVSDTSNGAFTILNEQFVDHRTSAFLASVTNEGTVGSLNAFVGTGPGNGFQFNPVNLSGQRLFEGALIIGTDSGHVSDGARDETQVYDSDFRFLSLLDTTQSAGLMKVITASLDDSLAEDPIGIRVNQRTVSFDSTGQNNFLIFELDVRNNTSVPISGLMVGAFFDWDVNPANAEDRGAVITDSMNTIPGVYGGRAFAVDMMELHQGASPNSWMGVVPLSASRFTARRILVSADEVYPPHMTDADKWRYITTNRATNPNGDGGSAADHAQVFGLGPFSLSTGATQRVGFAMAGGTSMQDFVDAARAAQRFWVQRLGNTINVVLVGVEGNIAEIPEQYVLSQNYPNPFNPSTTIRFAVPKTDYVTLKVFNLLGQEVAKLVAGQRAAGEYRVEWNATNLPSGVYMYRLQAGDFVASRKLLLLK